MAKKKKTAAELIAELGGDPDWVAAREVRNRRRERKVDALREEEKPLLRALSQVGVDVQSVWDLVNSHTSYTAALAVLLEHMQRPYSVPIREGIARALAVPEAVVGWGLLTTLYQREEDPRVKDGLAVTIAAAATGDVIEDVISLARDASHGSSRLLLLSALGRSSSSRAQRALMELAGDPELEKEVGVILKRKKRPSGSASPS